MSEAVILLVDDERTLLQSLKQQLRRLFGARFQYETAEDVPEGIGQQLRNGLKHAEAYNAADVGAWRGDQRGAFKRLFHRHADIRLAIDQRAVAIEEGKTRTH